MDAAVFTYKHSLRAVLNLKKVKMFAKEQEQDGDSPTVTRFGGFKRQQQYLRTLSSAHKGKQQSKILEDGSEAAGQEVGSAYCHLSSFRFSVDSFRLYPQTSATLLQPCLSNL